MDKPPRSTLLTSATVKSRHDPAGSRLQRRGAGNGRRRPAGRSGTVVAGAVLGWMGRERLASGLFLHRRAGPRTHGRSDAMLVRADGPPGQGRMALGRRVGRLDTGSVRTSAWLICASWAAGVGCVQGWAWGWSRVPIDPCRSPLPAPAGSQYYW